MADAYSHQHFMAGMRASVVQGFCQGQNPAVDSPNAKMVRGAMRNLKWLVVADLFETETAQVWKEPGVDPRGCQTEVFFIGRAGRRKGWLADEHDAARRWHRRAVEPPGDSRSDGLHRRS